MKEKRIPAKAQEKFKNIIKIAKSKGLVKSHIQAFQEVPLKDEKHKGEPKYFCD